MNGENALAPLSASEIAALLQTHTRDALNHLDVVQVTDSTNARLLAERPPPHGINVLFAEAQTAGRGRRGRSWHSPEGAHLYLSLGLIYRGELAKLPPLALAVGVACADAVEAVTGTSIQLKWPNDLYLDGRKLGGILIETNALTRSQVHVVIGIGLNVSMPINADDFIQQPWSDLRSSMADFDRNLLAAVLLDHLATMLLKFEAEGFDAFKADYRQRDLLLDREIEIHEATGIRFARACGVETDGALRVESLSDGAAQRLHAGEVSVRW